MDNAPTIARLFAVYLETQLSQGIDPIATADQRRAFFCGFSSCLRAIEVIGYTAENDNDYLAGVELLFTEWEQYAQETDYGIHATVH